MTIDLDKLIQSAKMASQKAYVPYSQFPVGACLLTSDGQLLTGCNVENISFGLTNCAERTAFFKAVSEGYRDFEHLVVYGETQAPISPCGACRQVMVEFCQPDMPVTLVSAQGDYQTMTVAELLPYQFNDLK